MKAAQALLTTSLFVLSASFTFAGPGAQYWAQRRAERTKAAATVTTAAPQAAETCCRVKSEQRPVASHKVTRTVKTVECSGCPTMAAGQKCTS